MSWTHLAAIVPVSVSVAGFAVLDWFAQRRKALLASDLKFMHDCCCRKLPR